MPRSFLLVAVTVLAVALGAAPAAAYPHLALRPGGTPFEGPTDEEISAIWWNPGALGDYRGVHAAFTGQLSLDQGGVQRSPICSSTGLSVGGCPAPGNVISFANARSGGLGGSGFGGATWDLGTETLTLAFGVYTPWQTSRSFTTSAGGVPPLGMSPTGYHLIAESFSAIYYTLAVALKLAQRWNIGVSLSITDLFADLTYDRDSALAGGSAAVNSAGYESMGAAQRVHVTGSGGTFWSSSVSKGIPSPTGLALGVGLMVRPTDRIYLGAAWSRMFFLFNTSGSQGVTAGVGATLTAADPASPCAGTGCTGSDTIDFDIPDVWHLGARFVLPRNLELSAWARVTVYGGYLRNQAAQGGLTVRLGGDPVKMGGAPARTIFQRGLQPAFAGELGLRWKPLPWMRLGASFIAESSAIPHEYLNPEFIEGPKLDTMLAVEFAPRFRVRGVQSRVRILVGYDFTGYLLSPVDNSAFNPQAQVACVDARYALGACGDALAGRGLPTAAGSYSLYEHRFSVGLTFDYGGAEWR